MEDNNTLIIKNIPVLTCIKCKHTWKPRKTTIKNCPICKTHFWQFRKIRKSNKVTI